MAPALAEEHAKEVASEAIERNLNGAPFLRAMTTTTNKKSREDSAAEQETSDG